MQRAYIASLPVESLLDQGLNWVIFWMIVNNGLWAGLFESTRVWMFIFDIIIKTRTQNYALRVFTTNSGTFCYWFLSLNLGILLITSWWSSSRLKKHSFFRGLISGRADYPLISQQRKTQDLLKNKALFIIKIKVLIWQLAQRCALYIQ